MTNIKIQKIKKKDYKTMLDIYIRAYLSVWEKWDKEQIKDFFAFLLKRKIKVKFVLEDKIIWWFIAEIKPWYEGNMLFDPELFIDIDYQKKWYGTILLKKALELAEKKHKAKTIVGFTFKNTFHINWYKKLWINPSTDRQMLYWDIKTIIQK